MERGGVGRSARKVVEDPDPVVHVDAGPVPKTRIEPGSCLRCQAEPQLVVEDGLVFEGVQRVLHGRAAEDELGHRLRDRVEVPRAVPVQGLEDGPGRGIHDDGISTLVRDEESVLLPVVEPLSLRGVDAVSALLPPQRARGQERHRIAHPNVVGITRSRQPLGAPF